MNKIRSRGATIWNICRTSPVLATAGTSKKFSLAELDSYCPGHEQGIPSRIRNQAAFDSAQKSSEFETHHVQYRILAIQVLIPMNSAGDSEVIRSPILPYSFPGNEVKQAMLPTKYLQLQNSVDHVRFR